MAEIYYNPHPLIMLKLALYSMLHHSFSFFYDRYFLWGQPHSLKFRDNGSTLYPSTVHIWLAFRSCRKLYINCLRFSSSGWLEQTNIFKQQNPNSHPWSQLNHHPKFISYTSVITEVNEPDSTISKHQTTTSNSKRKKQKLLIQI